MRHLNRSLICHHRLLQHLDLSLRSYEGLSFNKGNKELFNYIFIVWSVEAYIYI